MIEGWTHLVRGEQVRRGGVARVAHDVDAQGIPQKAFALQRRHQLALHDNPHTSTFGVFVHVAAAYEWCVEVRCDEGVAYKYLYTRLCAASTPRMGFLLNRGMGGGGKCAPCSLSRGWAVQLHHLHNMWLSGGAPLKPQRSCENLRMAPARVSRRGHVGHVVHVVHVVHARRG
jgi:hypothetical protein